MSSSSISFGSSSRRAASSSPRFSTARVGRRHPEPLVDLLLGAEGLGLAALVVGDAVLAHVEAASHGLRAQRLVVLARAGEVLEQVAECLRGTMRRSTARPECVTALRARLA